MRRAIIDGLENGLNPRRTALDIVGRINRATGRREGGIIGLTSKQTDAVIRARNELHNLDASYFNRKLRDRRFDPMVRRAIESGKKLAVADLDRIVGRYKDRFLNYRGEVIARTETIGALNAGRYEAAQQLGETAGLRADQIELVWDATGDSRTRDSHAGMDGQRVRQGEDFVTPTGYRLKYPGDRSGGAPASEVIQCRCVARMSVDFIKGLK